MRKPLDKPIRCLLVRPEFLEHTFYNPRQMFQMLGASSAAPPLGLLLTAAHLPESWELRFIDGDLDPITDADLDWASVLFISGKEPQHGPIMRLIERAHEREIPVVVGGAGPTLQPDAYVGEADYIVSGESERIIEELVRDIEAGVSKGIYRGSDPAELGPTKIPRWDLARLDGYMFVGMCCTRGCPFGCEFCAQIEIFGRKPRTETVETILAQHQRLYDLGYRGMIDLGYDNLIGDLKYAETLLSALAVWNREHGHPFFYSTEATMNLARQPRLLELMRENDFRYVFMGIESGDPEALKSTKKGQNVAMTPAEVVRTVNSYGIIVNTGLILGFDGERDDAGARMLAMIQESGAFPTLVLPLHALPNTQLARRLESEGRLFDGSLLVKSEDRTDTATSGLNFRTRRPRVQVMKDLVQVLRELYDPKNHYARTDLIIRQLKVKRRFRPSFRKIVSLLGSFVKIVRHLNRDPETKMRFWKAFRAALRTNPGALEAVIGQAVMNANYARQSRSYVAALEEQIREVEAVGEESYTRRYLPIAV